MTRFRRATIPLPDKDRLLTYKTNPLYLIHKIDSQHTTGATLTSENTVRKLSEKSRTRPQRSPVGHQGGAFHSILASVQLPNPRSEQCSHPFQTVSDQNSQKVLSCARVNNLNNQVELVSSDYSSLREDYPSRRSKLILLNRVSPSARFRSANERYSSDRNPAFLPAGDGVLAMALGIHSMKSWSHRLSKSPRSA